MSKALRVKIAGKEYTLRGDHEASVLRAAREVDGQVRELETSLNEQSTSTLSILAALNLAERLHDSHDQHKVDRDFVKQEIEHMIDHIQRAWE